MHSRHTWKPGSRSSIFNFVYSAFLILSSFSSPTAAFLFFPFSPEGLQLSPLLCFLSSSFSHFSYLRLRGEEKCCFPHCPIACSSHYLTMFSIFLAPVLPACLPYFSLQSSLFIFLSPLSCPRFICFIPFQLSQTIYSPFSSLHVLCPSSFRLMPPLQSLPCLLSRLPLNEFSLLQYTLNILEYTSLFGPSNTYSPSHLPGMILLSQGTKDIRSMTSLPLGSVPPSAILVSILVEPPRVVLTYGDGAQVSPSSGSPLMTLTPLSAALPHFLPPLSPHVLTLA